jgi:hypothetical protein
MFAMLPIFCRTLYIWFSCSQVSRKSWCPNSVRTPHFIRSYLCDIKQVAILTYCSQPCLTQIISDELYLGFWKPSIQCSFAIWYIFIQLNPLVKRGSSIPCYGKSQLLLLWIIFYCGWYRYRSFLVRKNASFWLLCQSSNKSHPPYSFSALSLYVISYSLLQRKPGSYTNLLKSLFHVPLPNGKIYAITLWCAEIYISVPLSFFAVRIYYRECLNF